MALTKSRSYLCACSLSESDIPNRNKETLEVISPQKIFHIPIYFFNDECSWAAF